MTGDHDAARAEVRQVLLEVVEALEAVVVALQVNEDRRGADIAVWEAVRRVVSLRQLLSRRSEQAG